MPLFTEELNRRANNIGADDLTIFLSTGTPSNSDPDNGIVTIGGGLYESGSTLAAADISDAANGNIDNDAAISFGASDEEIVAANHWVAKRGTQFVAFGTLPETTIAVGGSFSINVNSMQFNGSST